MSYTAHAMLKMRLNLAQDMLMLYESLYRLFGASSGIFSVKNISIFEGGLSRLLSYRATARIKLGFPAVM